MSEPPEDILRGAWDLHVHAAPSLFDRRADGVQLALEVRDAGMAGVVWKSHHGSTVEAAAVVDSQIDGVRVFGGVTLNEFVGGLNPDAVDAAQALGAKIVWLPTIHAQFHGEALGTPGGFGFQRSALLRRFSGGIRIVDDDGRLKDPLREILELLDGRDTVLATGHISPEEIFALVRAIRTESREIRVLVNHALFHAPSLNTEMISNLAGDDIFFETCHLSTTEITDATTAAGVAAVIKATPQAQWILATDSGQAANVPTPDALRSFATGLLEEGLSRKRLYQLMVANPSELLRC